MSLLLTLRRFGQGLKPSSGTFRKGWEGMRPRRDLSPVGRRVVSGAQKVLRTLGEVFYGMTVYDWVHELQKARREEERLFTLMVYGDLLGIPILPPYYALRLLPFLVPTLSTWRRAMLRERDLVDLISQEIG